MTTERKLFNENGFLLKKNFFDAHQVTTIRANAQKLFKNQFINVGLVSKAVAEELSEEQFNLVFFDFFEKYPERVITTGKHVQHMIDLHRLSLDKKIEDYLKMLGLNFPNVCTRPMLFFNAKKLAKKQVYWKTDPHQDWRSMQGSLNATVVWLPLMDIDVSLGALEVVPKSHLLGLNTTDFQDGFGTIPEAEAEKHTWESVEVQAGDVLFFSAMLFHRSGNNSTENGIRWSCHFRYNDMTEQKFIDRGYPHPYVYYPDPKLITPDFPTVQEVSKVYES